MELYQITILVAVALAAAYLYNRRRQQDTFPQISKGLENSSGLRAWERGVEKVSPDEVLPPRTELAKKPNPHNPAITFKTAFENKLISAISDLSVDIQASIPIEGFELTEDLKLSDGTITISTSNLHSKSTPTLDSCPLCGKPKKHLKSCPLYGKTPEEKAEILKKHEEAL